LPYLTIEYRMRLASLRQRTCNRGIHSAAMSQSLNKKHYEKTRHHGTHGFANGSHKWRYTTWPGTAGRHPALAPSAAPSWTASGTWTHKIGP
jgi:hypothetical protein